MCTTGAGGSGLFAPGAGEDCPFQRHLLTFEQEWTDKSDGRTLPGFVPDELQTSWAAASWRGASHNSCAKPATNGMWWLGAAKVAAFVRAAAADA